MNEKTVPATVIETAGVVPDAPEQMSALAVAEAALAERRREIQQLLSDSQPVPDDKIHSLWTLGAAARIARFTSDFQKTYGQASPEEAVNQMSQDLQQFGQRIIADYYPGDATEPQSLLTAHTLTYLAPGSKHRQPPSQHRQFQGESVQFRGSTPVYDAGNKAWEWSVPPDSGKYLDVTPGFVGKKRLVDAGQYETDIPNGTFYLNADAKKQIMVWYFESNPYDIMSATVKETDAAGTVSEEYSVVPLDNMQQVLRRKRFDIPEFPDFAVVCHATGRVELYSCKDTTIRTPSAVRKPVIYLYGQHTSHIVAVTARAGTIAYEYPPTDNHAWQATSNPDGSVTITTETYPYLFWEMELVESFKEDFADGFCVAGSEVREFLESLLTRLRLTAREKTDFITYWYPELAKHPYNKIRFMVDDECAVFADLKVDPPLGIRRLYMVYQPVQEPIYLLAQRLQPFTRNFTSECFEWGGLCVSASS